MGFVGGGGNNAITTSLPPSSFEYCIVNIKEFMEFIYLIFYACLRLLFLDVETNPGPRRPVPAVCIILCILSRQRRILWEYSCRIHCNTQQNTLLSLCGASPGALVTWRWLRLSMIYWLAQRLWSQICITCRSCWFPVSVALSCCVGARCLEPVGWRHTYEMVTEHFANRNLSVVVAKCWILLFVMWDRTFMCTVFIAPLT